MNENIWYIIYDVSIPQASPIYILNQSKKWSYQDVGTQIYNNNTFLYRSGCYITYNKFAFNLCGSQRLANVAHKKKDDKIFFFIVCRANIFALPQLSIWYTILKLGVTCLNHTTGIKVSVHDIKKFGSFQLLHIYYVIFSKVLIMFVWEWGWLRMVGGAWKNPKSITFD